MLRTVPLLFLLIFASCKKDELSTAPISEMPSQNAIVLKTGIFENGPYGRVSGVAKLLKTSDSYEIVLDSFMTSNGPDLYVYLSQEKMPINFISAGKLKSTNGRQVYPLNPVSGSLSTYKYIAIHCKAYNHLFGYASLP